MCRPIRILFVIDYFHSTGGTERHLSLLVRNLCRESFEATVVAFDLGENPLIDEMRQAGAAVIHLPLARVYTPHAMVQAWRLLRLIQARRIEIVQTFHQKADTFGAIVARFAGVRHIVSSRRDTGELKSRHYVLVSRRIRSLFERVIVVSEGVGTAVVQREGIDRADIVRIYNGVDAEEFQPPTLAEATNARHALGFSDEDFVVGMVANFRPEKSHAVLFAAAREAMRRIPRLKLLLVGNGPLFAHYSAQHVPSAGGPDALFVGAVPDVQRYLHAMDIACLIPGANEGFSNAVLEKMATGLPLVVSDIGGNAEAVIDGRNGVVVPPNEVAALAEALVALHADPSRRRAMGRESRRLVEERFSLDQMWRAHAELYRSLNVGSTPPEALTGAATC